MTAKDHNKLLGIFLLVHGGLQAFGMLIAALIYGGMGTFMLANARRSEEQMVGWIVIGMILFLLFLTLIFVVPQLLGGWKVMKEKPGARTWGIVASIVALLSFPLGTAVGVYGLWYLFGDVGKNYYSGGGNYSAPPPPNNWR